jgi:predicted transcriptional regulator
MMAYIGQLLKIRAQEDIITLILGICEENRQATKLQIMYHTYLSDHLCKECLLYLVKNGLLEYSDETKVYSITKEGSRLLQAASAFVKSKV